MAANPAPARSGAARRRRRRLVRGGEYGLVVAVLVAVGALADWNSLRTNFFNTDVIGGLFPDIITIGLRNTVVYTAIGFVLGLTAGLVLALMRLSSVPPYRWFAIGYVEVFRGLPALLIFIFVGVGVPLAFPGTSLPGGVYGQAGLALALVSAAYMAETIRAGIQAVPRGQMEAARSLGMSHSRAMRTIIVPQALRTVVPPLTNELVLLFKDSSLALFIGVSLDQRELAKFGQDLAGEKNNTTPIVVAGLCYLAVTIPLGYLARRLEARRGGEAR
ncbi:amino acid ABC transporter permease [Actinomadura atramentaria]|uniref:amino acid ABC transporter permease n=1 Tax=Actinomadura atramentaria TaxID=1990 RepID=UPI00036D2322|nr:amino acid ABC transporter permease [Actinomadura atramentaria]